FPRKITYFGWGWNQLTLQDHAGDWWIPTGQGLCRFAKAARAQDLRGARPTKVYTTRDGLIGDNIFRLFEDSRGDVWIGTVGSGPSGVTRWDRRENRFYRYSERDGLPKRLWPTAFAQDLSGRIWIGGWGGGIARYLAGHFAFLTPEQGVPR